MSKSKPQKGKRSYLLPGGCKDLIDVTKKQAAPAESNPPQPRIRAWVFLPEKVSMRYMAHIAGDDLRTLYGRMRQLGIVCTFDRAVDFADAQRVLLTYGIQAEPAEPESGRREVFPPGSHTTGHAGPRPAVPGIPCGLSSTLSLLRWLCVGSAVRRQPKSVQLESLLPAQFSPSRVVSPPGCSPARVSRYYGLC